MSKKYPEVTIHNTETRKLFSSKVGQEFKISVAFPYTYASSENNYPVIYVLDANAAFGSVTEITRGLQLLKEMPETLIVGIDYPMGDFRASLGVRFRDLTPTENDEWLDESLEEYTELFGVPLESSGTGGADDFLHCIHEELMPFVKENYRVDPDDKTIVGGSLGGLFALYVLFHQSSTFDRYIISSPSIWWDNKSTFAHEANYAVENADLSAVVFMSVGALEESEDEPDESSMVSDMQKLAKTLEARSYENLKLTTHLFENETHASVAPAAISRGLKAIFGQKTEHG